MHLFNALCTNLRTYQKETERFLWLKGGARLAPIEDVCSLAAYGAGKYNDRIKYYMENINTTV